MSEITPCLVRVLWEDAACLDDGTWVTDESSDYKPVLITSVGFLLHDSEAGVIITAAWSPDNMGPRDQIPRGMIRRMDYLEPVVSKGRKTK